VDKTTTTNKSTKQTVSVMEVQSFAPLGEELQNGNNNYWNEGQFYKTTSHLNCFFMSFR
jgi:hypothetical protein